MYLTIKCDGYNLNIRELEILENLSEGRTSAVIARILCIAKDTTDNYRKELLHKMHALNTADLIRKYLDIKNTINGLL